MYAQSFYFRVLLSDPADRLRRMLARLLSGGLALSAAQSEDSREAARQALNRRAEEALDTYGTSIYRLAYSYLHSACDAEDILQDTLVQLLRAAPVFQSPAHEKAWLLRVAGNLSKNRLAYNRIRATDELRDTLAAEEREDLSFVWDAVRALPVRYREVIHLFYHEGYSTAQIAKILNRRESTVRSHLRRGRDKLRELLKGRDDLETGI